MAVDITELEVLAENMAEMSEEAVIKVRRFVGQASSDIAVRMRREAPWDSGKLERSIRYDIAEDGLSSVIAPHATDDRGRPYPYFVEYGTSDTAPDPFVKRTADWADATLPPRIAKMLESLL